MALYEVDKSKVNLLKLSASCLSSAIVAADQITALACPTTGEAVRGDNLKENKKNARLKIDGSFVTDADIAAQQIIVDALHRVSRGIRIVGEESEEEMRNRTITGHERRIDSISRLALEEIMIRREREKQQHQQQNVRKIRDGHGYSLPLAQHRKFIDESAKLVNQEQISSSKQICIGREDSHHYEDNKSIFNRVNEMKEFEIDVDRVSVFIDPLDATNSYAKGDHEPVSILVAIILDKTPCFGVICKPFGYPERTLVLDTGCMAVYGGILLGGAYIAGGCAIDSRRKQTSKHKEELAECIDSDRKKLPRAVISKSRSKGIVSNFVSYLGERGIIHPEPLFVSGAGEKSLRIITGFKNEGLWFYPKGGTSLWDVAASDALLRVIGGRLTDKYGNDMDYSKSRKEAENKNGVIACYDERLHEDCIRLFLEGSWEDA